VDTVLARGNVDEWLMWVEERMVESIHSATSISFNEFVGMTRG